MQAQTVIVSGCWKTHQVSFKNGDLQPCVAERVISCAIHHLCGITSLRGTCQ